MSLDPLQRIAISIGILAGIATILSFVIPLPAPFNYTFLAITVVVLLVAAFWHGRQKSSDKATKIFGPAVAQDESEVLYDKTFVVKKNEFEPLRVDCTRGDVISLIAKANGPFNWYLLDKQNFSKYEKGLVRVSSDAAGTSTLNEKRDIKARNLGPYYLIVENARKEDISVEILISLSHKSQ
jgi:hypothetical protein